MNPFEFVNSINMTKKDIMVKDNEKDYIPFVVNRTLSYFLDTIFLVNEMNINHQLDKTMQYHFLLHLVCKRKRFAKWHKSNKNDIEAIQFVYNVNQRRAQEMLSLLNAEQLNTIRDSKRF